jgi:hypothetical protein
MTPDSQPSLAAMIADLALVRPPWEALIEQLAQPAPAFWQEPPHSRAAVLVDDVIVQLVLNSAVRAPALRAKDFLRDWIGRNGKQVDIVETRALSLALSKFSGEADACAKLGKTSAPEIMWHRHRRSW